MPINSSDIKYYKSSQTNSNGGTITATQIVSGVLNNLFPNVTPKEASGDKTIYRKIFVKNTHATDTFSDACVYLDSDSDGDELYIGVGTSSDNKGEHVDYYKVSSSDAGLVLGDLTPGLSKSIWIKRVFTPGVPYNNEASNILIVEGVTI